MTQAAIVEAFVELSDPRRRAGQRHTLPLCLALFTLAIAAGNKGFLAIGDWLGCQSRPTCARKLADRSASGSLVLLTSTPTGKSHQAGAICTR